MKSEVRNNPDGTLDEIFATGRIHLEQMDHDHWWLGIYTDQGDLTVDLCSNRKGLLGTRVDANVEGQFDENDQGKSLEYSERCSWAMCRGLLLYNSLTNGGMAACSDGHWLGVRDVMAVVSSVEAQVSMQRAELSVFSTKLSEMRARADDLAAKNRLLLDIIQDGKGEATENTDLEKKLENALRRIRQLKAERRQFLDTLLEGSKSPEEVKSELWAQLEDSYNQYQRFMNDHAGPVPMRSFMEETAKVFNALSRCVRPEKVTE